MPRTRSQVQGGLPQLEWGTDASDAQRAAAAAAGEARAERQRGNVPEPNEAALGVSPDANLNRNPKAAVANEAEPNPHD